MIEPPASLVTYSFADPQAISAATGNFVAFPDEPFTQVDGVDPKNFVGRFSIVRHLVDRSAYARFADEFRRNIFLYDEHKKAVTGWDADSIDLVFKKLLASDDAFPVKDTLQDLRDGFRVVADALTRIVRTRNVVSFGSRYSLFQVGGYHADWDRPGQEPVEVSFLEAAAYAAAMEMRLPTERELKYARTHVAERLNFVETERGEWTSDFADRLAEGGKRIFRLVDQKDPLSTLNLLPFTIGHLPKDLTLPDLFDGYHAISYPAEGVTMVSQNGEGADLLARRLGLAEQQIPRRIEPFSFRE